MDEQTLKQIADATGGKYFNAQDTESLENVYAEIDRLEKSPSEGRLYSEYHELYQYFMFPGLGLILVEIVLAGTRFSELAVATAMYWENPTHPVGLVDPAAGGMGAGPCASQAGGGGQDIRRSGDGRGGSCPRWAARGRGSKASCSWPGSGC